MEPKLIKLIIGCLLLIIGITMILQWWPQLVTVFKGSIGLVLALSGLVVLYTLKF